MHFFLMIHVYPQDHWGEIASVLAGIIIVTSGLAALYARLFRKPMREMAYWAVVTIAALVLVAGWWAALQPCESDRFRRCDLEAPSPKPTPCFLTGKC